MANVKISLLPAETDVNNILGFAGYNAGGTCKISGADLINTLPAASVPPLTDVLTAGYTVQDQLINIQTTSDARNTTFSKNGIEQSNFAADITLAQVAAGRIFLSTNNNDIVLQALGSGQVVFNTAEIDLQSGDVIDSTSSSGSAGDVLSSLGAGSGTEWIAPTNGTVTSVELDFGTTGFRTTGASSQTITNSGTFDISGTLVPSNGGTGITNYGQACEIFLSSATVGPNSLGNSNNDTTYVAPMDTLAFNDDATLYTPVFNTGIFGAANWAGGIQVSQDGRYLVEGQYFSFDGQTPTVGGVQQMEVWAEVNSANNTHSASWPTTATAGDIYLLGGGQTSTTLSGNAGQYGSRIVTASSGDYIRILFRHADFSGGTGFPVYTDSFTGPVTGLEGYRVRLTITKMS